MTKAFNPSTKALGSRKLTSVRADLAAFVEWAVRVQNHRRAEDRLSVEFLGAAAILWISDGIEEIEQKVARVVLRDGSWHLQWADRSDRWRDYDNEVVDGYLTLAIPMLLIEQDEHGAFWG